MIIQLCCKQMINTQDLICMGFFTCIPEKTANCVFHWEDSSTKKASATLPNFSAWWG